MRAIVLAVLSFLALAGCTSDVDGPLVTPSLGADATPGPAETLGGATGASEDEAETDAGVSVIPFTFEGNVGSGATGCIDPPGECASIPVSQADSSLVFEDLVGLLEGGEILLTWEPASPATSSLSAGFMVMGGGEECASVSLAEAEGASPLTLQVAAMPRAFCADEVLHLWVAGTQWAQQGPAYYQVDVEQPFAAEGSLSVRVGEPPPG